jgi:hypothetical protein
MRGVGPAVIGALAVSLVQMAPHAAPDPFTWFLLVATVSLMLLTKVGPMSLMFAGALVGLLQGQGVGAHSGHRQDAADLIASKRSAIREILLATSGAMGSGIKRRCQIYLYR